MQPARRALIIRQLLLGMLVAAFGCRGTDPAVAGREAIRSFGPQPPRPATVRNPLMWRPVVADSGRFAIYLGVIWRGEGANRFEDADAAFWDPAEGRLMPVSDHADPTVRPEIALDGSSVIFAEQRDPGTRRDGVNPDPWVKRVVRWDRSTGAVSGLSDFHYTRIADLALSADGSTVAFIGDGNTFVGSTAGGGPPRDVTHDSINQREGYGSTGDGALSLSGDGHITAYTNLRGPGAIFVHDRTAGVTSPLQLHRDGAAGYQNDPSLCVDGSRLAFTGGTQISNDDDRHQTLAAALVIDVASGTS